MVPWPRSTTVELNRKPQAVVNWFVTVVWSTVTFGSSARICAVVGVPPRFSTAFATWAARTADGARSAQRFGLRWGAGPGASGPKATAVAAATLSWTVARLWATPM